jgi:type IV secretion system protein VirB1
LVSTESAGNPCAIGVVGGRLGRQPSNLAEALATARALKKQGFNFSMGLGQVDRYKFTRYGETYEALFEPCRNLRAAGAILKACFQRTKARIGDDQRALRAAFSCYYSGNLTRGFQPDEAGQQSYVQKVVANATAAPQPILIVPAVQPESIDKALPVRPTDRPSAHAKQVNRTVAPVQWVIFADAPQQRLLASPVHAEWSEEQGEEHTGGPAVRVQRVTPSGGAASASDLTAAVPLDGQSVAQRDVQAVPVRRTRPNSVQQDAPFVQFVN